MLLEEKMRKLLICIIVLGMFFCSSCYRNSGENDMIKYETGIFQDKNWEEQIGTYQGDAIPDKKTAIGIATQIFDGMKKSSTSQEYTPQAVFYDEEDDVWIISFWKESERITLGGDCNIAIQKKDGRVLRIGFGE